MTGSAGNELLLELGAPLAGWVMPLSDVPDPVFAAGMAGDGVAIDPLGETLHAPCDGVIALLGANRHALTLRARGIDVLLHVGIDTLKLQGAGFKLCVRDGERVRAGQLLLEFDLDAVVRSAPSAITPVLVVGERPHRIIRRRHDASVAVGDPIYAVELGGALAPAGDSSAPTVQAARREFRVPFDHGLHARPAAQVAAALANLDAEVVLLARGREANARSVVAMMALGVTRGELVKVSARGPQAVAALAALDGLLEPITVPEPARRAVAPPAPPAAGARLAGRIAVRGLVAGVAAPLSFAEPAIGAASGDPAAERARLTAAIDAAASSLKNLPDSGPSARLTLRDAHLAMLNDPQLRHDAELRLADGESAGASWRGAVRGASDALLLIDDPRMAERRADLLDIERQVLRVLAGDPPMGGMELPPGAIVLADELLPSQLLSLDPARLAGICMAEGGVTSHVAILCASLGIPTLVAAGAPVLAIAGGTPLVLDAEAGCLIVDPAQAERARFAARIAARAAGLAEEQAAAQLPARLRDGTVIRVYCNLGTGEETSAAVEAGAEGCGLLRTEFLFLARRSAPDEDEQLAQYQAIADALGGRPLTIRTLDAGGDKPIGYLTLPHESNPALGLRGLRTGLAHPELLRTQLRAIVRVQPQGLCRVLLPMVTDLDDLRAVRMQLAEAARDLGAAAPPLGIMVETPAAALLADQLTAECDFLAIGSNDLSQYTLAIDRLHPTLGARLDGLHPAVLRLMDRAARAAEARGIEAGLCGSLAGDPEAAALLIGLGVRELSLAPAQIPHLKALLRTFDAPECAVLAQRALALGNAAEVRALVREWSERNG